MGIDEFRSDEGDDGGKYSVSTAVEEISGGEFESQTAAAKAASKSSGNSNSNNPNIQQSRVWAMRDLYKCQTGLYNFAWAQGVHNKPLDEVIPEVKSAEELKSNLTSLNSHVNDVNGRVVIDLESDEFDGNESEKEEGELEEGEIDLESDVLDRFKEDELDTVMKDNELDKQTKSIIEQLKAVTIVEAEKSFGEVCSRMHDSLVNLQEMRDSVSEFDYLVQLSFTAFQTMSSVFSSLSPYQKGLIKSVYKRLLSYVTTQNPARFPPSQMREIEVMIQDLDESPAFLTSIDNKGRGLSVPLLDLHKDHDADSLPSPTRSNAPLCSPLSNMFGVTNVVPREEWSLPKGSQPVQERKNSTLHPYETDAVKAVSSYQQKFGRSSFLTFDRLPSPTPSGESDDRNEDVGGEVSSSSVADPVKPVNTFPNLASNSSSRLVRKNRDPRLRISNHEATNSRKKQRSVEDLNLDAKRQKISENGHGKLPMPSSNSAVSSLQTILKDITVNPTMWMNIIKKEQRKIVDPSATSSQLQIADSIVGAVPLLNTTLQKPALLGQTTSGILPNSPQPTDEAGKIRMKPRDPRRILHHNVLVKTETLQPKVLNTNIAPTPLPNRQEIQSLTSPTASISVTTTLPDISRQFTTKLKNVADIISVTQTSTGPPISPQVPLNKLDVKVLPVPESADVKGAGAITSSPESSMGTSQPQNKWGDVEHLFEGFDDQQKATIQKERTRRIEEQKTMFSARKLCLVLDLDHTLLNSAKFTEVDPLHEELLRKKEEQEMDKPYRHLFRFPHMGMWTKLRPGIWNFLEKASKLFELHLYTMGNKLYATEMAKLLDPKGVLFSGRVMSRGDEPDSIDGEPRAAKIKDLDGVLGMESAVVIIDDSIRVWPHNKLNLIVVERYIYFPCSRRQFGLLGPSLLEIDHDERPENGTLASSLGVIERIHKNFFSHHSLDDADVRAILASEQKKILAGCRVMFSRIFPVGEANPHLHPLWMTAEQFGAVCTNHIDDQVTHVVAHSPGTDKVNWALSRGRFVVHPGWVEASALLYRRANEHDFAIKQ
ncbi:RNA polymerase II C-terminal domain phosphatase-like 3 [Impatiens glandulifera]|uniref:RNA polymerase II C-terminal domain phosphatase-like 3 n=1 Tax=Impatiens glandulifera TaxID=253017 RepID=UPI001FB0DD6B|nr:RNA polymerase II C-terminal domain phosphatase-like 3 [Impatiens glandulifera]